MSRKASLLCFHQEHTVILPDSRTMQFLTSFRMGLIANVMAGMRLAAASAGYRDMCNVNRRSTGRM